MTSFPRLIVLSIDTTGPAGSIALVSDAGVLEEVPMESADGFAHVVFGEIEALLERHHLAMGEIGGFAAASGPGSFTGVRVGLAAAKGLAEANGKQVVPVSNLKALASFGTREFRATLIDARRGEIYGAVYDSALRLARSETVVGMEHWLNGLKDGFPAEKLEFITQGGPLSVPLGAAARGKDGTAGPVVPGPLLQAPRSLAGAVGQIAVREFRLGLGQNPAQIDANYVRRPDAELLWREPDRR